MLANVDKCWQMLANAPNIRIIKFLPPFLSCWMRMDRCKYTDGEDNNDIAARILGNFL